MARPRTIKSVEEFEAMSGEYFAIAKLMGEPLTVAGLALAVGLCSRDALLRYEKAEGYEEFHVAVKNAKLKIENSYAVMALKGGGAGPIFLLKASFGYEDRRVVDVNATGEIKVVMSEKDAKL